MTVKVGNSNNNNSSRNNLEDEQKPCTRGRKNDNNEDMNIAVVYDYTSKSSKIAIDADMTTKTICWTASTRATRSAATTQHQHWHRYPGLQSDCRCRGIAFAGTAAAALLVVGARFGFCCCFWRMPLQIGCCCHWWTLLPLLLLSIMPTMPYLLIFKDCYIVAVNVCCQ